MEDVDWLAGRFEEHRSRLRAVAYRMLGSVADADDAVQETWLRLSRSDTSGVENLAGWMTTVIGRVCLNMLQARRVRHEEPFAALAPLLDDGESQLVGVEVPDRVHVAHGHVKPDEPVECGHVTFASRTRVARTVPRLTDMTDGQEKM
jgi:DNA-directed RNA polymerase specialized sigma24 family protein